MTNEHYYKRSPIPPHLSSKEREEWEKHVKHQKQEIKRRKKEKLYPYSTEPKPNFFVKIVRRFKDR
tara:strand:+ start:4197 stop:4394 length:198 start_codon:yes stop_codon:yes gene_type:complete